MYDQSVTGITLPESDLVTAFKRFTGVLPSESFAHFCMARCRTAVDDNTEPPEDEAAVVRALDELFALSRLRRPRMSSLSIALSGCPSGISPSYLSITATIGSISVSADATTHPPPLIATSYHRRVPSSPRHSFTEAGDPILPDRALFSADHASAAASAMSPVTSAA